MKCKLLCNFCFILNDIEMFSLHGCVHGLFTCSGSCHPRFPLSFVMRSPNVSYLFCLHADINKNLSTKWFWLTGFLFFFLSMFDVGGQRDERRKWIQCFNGRIRISVGFIKCSLQNCSPNLHFLSVKSIIFPCSSIRSYLTVIQDWDFLDMWTPVSTQMIARRMQVERNLSLITSACPFFGFHFFS